MTAADPSPLVLAVVAAVYVLMILVAWWGRRRQTERAREWRTDHAELLRELERYEHEAEP